MMMELVENKECRGNERVAEEEGRTGAKRWRGVHLEVARLDRTSFYLPCTVLDDLFTRAKV